jgi:hypothetical protein
LADQSGEIAHGLLEQMLDALRGMERSHRALLDIVKVQGDRITSLELAAQSGRTEHPS